MRMIKPQIIKATGETEDFSEYKLNHSLIQAGVEKTLRHEIIESVKEHLRTITPTDDIHEFIFNILKHTDSASAARYNLRRAVMALGPTGFPFEQYVSNLLSHYDYQTETNKIIKGVCVNHEVDIVAIKSDTRYMIECKFHNKVGVKSDIKTALYIWARFGDISQAWENNKQIEQKIHQAWLITNTKVTSDAENFAKCRGMAITSWYRPYRKSLKDMIVNSGMWPVTCLTSLPSSTHEELIKQNMYLCKDVMHTSRHKIHGITSHELKIAREEAEFVCQIPNLNIDVDIDSSETSPEEN